MVAVALWHAPGSMPVQPVHTIALKAQHSGLQSGATQRSGTEDECDMCATSCALLRLACPLHATQEASLANPTAGRTAATKPPPALATYLLLWPWPCVPTRSWVSRIGLGPPPATGRPHLHDESRCAARCCQVLWTARLSLYLAFGPVLLPQGFLLFNSWVLYTRPSQRMYSITLLPGLGSLGGARLTRPGGTAGHRTQTKQPPASGTCLGATRGRSCTRRCGSTASSPPP